MKLYEYTPGTTANYKSKLSAFQKTIDGFKDQPVEVQHALVNMVTEANKKYRQHIMSSEGAHFTALELEKTFGRGKFDQINNVLKMFVVLKGGNSYQHVTHAYIVTDKVLDTYRKAIRKKPRGRLKTTYDLFDRRIRKLRRALVSRGKNEQTRLFWKQYEKLLPHEVPINIEKLDELEKKVSGYSRLTFETPAGETRQLFKSGIEADNAERMLDAIAEVRARATRDVTGRGVSEHNYREGATGRLWAINAGNLQNNANRIIRKYALYGMWDYDFSNCHYILIYQLALSYGYECKHIRDYLANKQGYRLRLSAEFNLPVTAVKEILLALMYGARLSGYWESAVYDLVGGNRDKMERVKDHEIVSGIYNDLKHARKVILENYPKWGRKYKNLAGLTIHDSKEDKEILAFIIQGIEAKALSIALQHFHKDIVLLIHDGFICRERLPQDRVNDMLKDIADQTGFVMELDEDRLIPEPEELYLTLNK
jgi:hypothetical protein